VIHWLDPFSPVCGLCQITWKRIEGTDATTVGGVPTEKSIWHAQRELKALITGRRRAVVDSEASLQPGASPLVSTALNTRKAVRQLAH
jgi:hypothetical protein